ncbi:ribosomal RNA small subunit methyltransferase E [Geobacter sp. OR-1]|uniref:16S rRNA (uracil(1498)-N(3))-methyltransferase n=1 Tax=Geobacter sp. OR-1 TaxID=1266765 RepID=UPI000542478F|nr:16S rRNA (uracil(1498)-N(3))-methyltransferase [Geobacter sp. OR-1]GAM11212.1 ribosomal RNA small subunit methyltransferase E [Geobacter sp. OR-1]
MRRFLVATELVPGESLTIDGELYRHMVRVLRLHPEDLVILCDVVGAEFTAVIRRIDSRSLILDILDRHSISIDRQGIPAMTLVQGLPRSDKFDLIIQKATELGVHSIIAFPSSRSVVKIPKAQLATKITRWNKIASEASRQSERTTVPAVTYAETLEAALQGAGQSVKLLLFEREQTNRLRETLAGIDRPDKVTILAGPEGGFSETEVSSARSNGCVTVSLGPRILRTETAGIAMLAILQYQWGDIG